MSEMEQKQADDLDAKMKQSSDFVLAMKEGGAHCPVQTFGRAGQGRQGGLGVVASPWEMCWPFAFRHSHHLRHRPLLGQEAL